MHSVLTQSRVADHEHVFLMGIGNAFWGVTRLLTQRGTSLI